MSASGAALTTSAPNTSISSARKRLNGVENVTSDAVSSEGIPVGGSKEPSHVSKRGDSSIGRSKDMLIIKKNLAMPNDSPRRRRTSRNPRSRFETILHILIKFLVLLSVLFWLGQQIWKWVDKSEHNSISTPFSAVEIEGRIWEVEASLKKMTKMTQVQLEVMDERGKQTVDKSVSLDRELRNLVTRTNNLDKTISDLSRPGFLSKKEFDTFLSELKESKSVHDDSKDFSFDDITSYAKEVIIKEIEKHAADGLGRVDYALAAGGGRVTKHSEPFVSQKINTWLPKGKGRNSIHSNAQKMLEPSFGQPGQCFALQGSNGFIEIRLRSAIIPEAVTLEHVAKSVAYDRSSAPKDCRVYGRFEGSEFDPSSSDEENMVLLKEIRYDLESNNAQTFSIDLPISLEVVNIVRLEFSSNHGSPSHTCIYRFRVHGLEPGSITEN
ncbi:SAD1/UNC-84 domain protein 1 [Zostera marina]|uniref:SAD1/UNC-84 domain protein 1 n=1 Tax=Zostera marina TaxID=29655 RepID=A0A0K9P569_ZOSMR|nr:SAD1/UNC-84 domain protein 1 [Zostera marina]